MSENLTGNQKSAATFAFLQFAAEILSSSSSSEDEEENMFLDMPEDIPKIPNYMDVVENYSNEQFRKNFRMDWNTFEHLHTQFSASEWSKKTGHGGSPMTTPRCQLLSFLWFSGNKCSIRDVSSRFNMAQSTFHKNMRNTISFLVEIATSIIKFPRTFEEKTHVAEQFEQISGFPGVIGCIDGSYIPILTPSNKIKSTYVNRHDMPSLTLQAICDANKRFLDVFTGIPSKIHDARVYRMSFISNDMEALCGDDFHIIGDAAYPLRQYLLTPYKDYGNLTPARQIYNLKFSQTRVKIENSFGLLKQRFLQLLRVDTKTVPSAARFIIACCVLHNICLDLNDNWENEHEAMPTINQDYEEPRNLRVRGEEKRERICASFVNRGE